MMRAYVVIGLFIYCALLVEGHISEFGPCVLVKDEPCLTKFVKIYLYTRDNWYDPQYIEFNETYDNLTYSSFNPKNPNKFLVHGYNSDQNLGVLVNLRNQYLSRYDVNIWVIDWSPLVANGCYVFAALNTKQCGRCIATLIDRMRLINKDVDIHLVGFSLGAHTTSSAATYLHPYRIRRITGLDPALPLFLSNIFGIRLTKDYANFVDIVHTNALVQGQFEAIGHVDFYMNGGYSQPGCGKFIDPESWGCDHHRSVEYFAESVNTKVGFYGWECNIFSYIVKKCQSLPPYEIMGEDVKETARGIYFVETAAESPYATGQPSLNKTVSIAPIFMQPTAKVFYITGSTEHLKHIYNPYLLTT